MPVKGTAKTVLKIADWDYVLDYRSRALKDHPQIGGLTLEELRASWRATSEAYKAMDDRRGRFAELGLSWQEMAMAMVTSMSPGKCVIETGVRTGVSTRFLLLATTTNGQLHSIDPLYTNETKAMDGMLRAMNLSLPRLPGGHWTFYGKRSVDCLLGIAKKTGGWDVFVHDSDHSLECMTFELEFGWAMLRPGGLLICDDWEHSKLNGRSHGAFLRFCERRDLEFHTIGSAAVIEKGDSTGFEATPFKQDPTTLFKSAVSVAVEDTARLQPGSPPAYVTYLND